MDIKKEEDFLSQKFGLEDQKISQEQNQNESLKDQNERRNKIMKHISDSKYFNDTYSDNFYTEQVDQDKEYLMEFFENDETFQKVAKNNPEFLNKRQIDFIRDMYLFRLRKERLEYKHGRIGSQILRGKLGIDNLFIGFGLIGILLIPSYFYLKQKKYKKKLENFKQQQLQNRSQNEFDLDEVSYNHSFMDQKEYDKKVLRQAKIEDKLKRLDKYSYKSNQFLHQKLHQYIIISFHMEGNFFQWNVNLKLDGIEYPISREGHSLNYYQPQNILILFGGMNSTKNNDLFFFSLKQNCWLKQNPKGMHPQQRCYHQSFIYQNYFFVFGGQSQHNKTLNDLFVLDIEKLIWKRVSLQKPPVSRSQFGLTINQQTGEVYIFGGLNLPQNQFLNDLWQLNVSNLQFANNKNEIQGCSCDQIQQYENRPIARKGFFFELHKKNLYLYGGICIDPNICTDEIFQFNIEKKVWSKINCIEYNLQSRNNFSTCQMFEDVFFIYGGIDNVNKNNFKNLLAINLQDFTITEPFVGGQSPGCLNGHDVCIDQKNKIMYLLGGVDGQIKGMDIYSLNVYSDKNKNIEWEQKIRKNQFEQIIEERGLDYLFEVNKKNNKLKDQILIESQKENRFQIQLNQAQEKCDKFKDNQIKEILQLKENLKQKQLQKEEQYNQIEKNLLFLNQLDFQYDLEEQKIQLFQQNFQKIYSYTQMLDRVLNKILQSFLKRLRQELKKQTAYKNCQRVQSKTKVTKKIILRLFNIIKTIF